MINNLKKILNTLLEWRNKAEKGSQLRRILNDKCIALIQGIKHQLKYN